MRKVAIIDGCRTPFVKAGGKFAALSALDLGKSCVTELINRTEINASDIGEIVYGVAIAKPSVPNIAREIALAIGLPKTIPAHTVQMACATSLRTAAIAALSIALGENQLAIAGGAESLSDLPITVSEPFRKLVLEANTKKSQQEAMYTLLQAKLQDLLPQPMTIAEPYTGLTMGEHCELMNRQWSVSRSEQDEYALRSHALAALAIADGRIPAELFPVYAPPDYIPVVEDDIVRKTEDREKVTSLKPVFDPDYGTVTAANSSPLTDGAAALLLADEEYAKAHGYRPKAYIKAWAFSGLDPDDGLLLGPVYATAKLLERTGLSLAEIDLIEMHEAFAGQVLCNLKAFASTDFARKKLGRSSALGEIPLERLNVCGGSIALGHPFAATGARMLTSLASEMARREARYGLATACAAGALGASILLEREQ
ncbi:MAG: acetyl-CoA C-acyltransferase [Acidobacteriota bacterium]|nr:acetyl-CoA C-acyltransferase [Blastocatellia bacterium]MDW8411833.1 acetyl-CoA C-acyltransferase [Acidobacteriota bacterium]